MQLTDSHTTEYITRLREEPILLALADKAVSYFQRVKDAKNVAFVALRQAEHFYYKTENVYLSMRKLAEASKVGGVEPADVKATPTEIGGAENKSAAANGIAGACSEVLLDVLLLGFVYGILTNYTQETLIILYNRTKMSVTGCYGTKLQNKHVPCAVNGTTAAGEAVEIEEKFTDPIKLTIPQDFHLPECCHKLMRDLTQQIFLNGDERSKARAVLTHIYHMCIHDGFQKARELLLMSHLQVRCYFFEGKN